MDEAQVEQDWQRRRSSRKFLLALMAMIASIVGLFTDELDGGTWVAALTLILGVYGAANVAQRKVEQ